MRTRPRSLSLKVVAVVSTFACAAPAAHAYTRGADAPVDRAQLRAPVFAGWAGFRYAEPRPE